MDDGEHHNSKDRLSEAKDSDFKTSLKVASEAVCDEQQAQAYEPKFRSFSGLDGEKLGALAGAAASRFVLEDRTTGKEVSSKGEQYIPRPSFVNGLSLACQDATSPEERAEVTARFSIEYMLRKAEQILGSAHAAVTSGIDSFLKGDQSDATPIASPAVTLAVTDSDLSMHSAIAQERHRRRDKDEILEAQQERERRDRQFDTQMPMILSAIVDSGILTHLQREGTEPAEYKMFIYSDGSHSKSYQSVAAGVAKDTGSHMFLQNPELEKELLQKTLNINRVVPRIVIHTHPDLPGADPTAFSKEDIQESNANATDSIIIAPDGTLYLHYTQSPWGPMDVRKISDKDRVPDRVLGRFDKFGGFHPVRG